MNKRTSAPAIYNALNKMPMIGDMELHVAGTR